MPERIQRRIANGWVMPPNTVYVGRGGIFENPFIVGTHGTKEECVEMFRLYLDGRIAGMVGGPAMKWQAQKLLSGHNLMCWCKLNEPCHVDVLLEVSNVAKV